MAQLKKIILFLLAFGCFQFANATHNRAGEILYRSVPGDNPFLFEITVITYTKTGGASNSADRCSLEVNFGDGTSDTVNRSNGLLGVTCDPGVGIGEDIPGISEIQFNKYVVLHEFPGAGTYTVSMEDPMRNEGVQNIPNSGNVPFYIESKITIDVNSGGNSAPQLTNPPIDNACLGLVFEHNPGALDLDGDSLVYSIIASRSYGGQTIGGYSFPNEISAGPNNSISINTVTGTLTWDSPQQLGEYNVAILIEEYRKNLNSGAVFKVGEVMRDIQINVGICQDNSPPIIQTLTQACITAGQTFNDTIFASDIDEDEITLTGTGYPLEGNNGGALTSVELDTLPNTEELIFTWQTTCNQVRNPAYWVYFKAKENKPSNSGLADFEELELFVLSPAVRITSVEPAGNTLTLNWTQADCAKANGYSIYRFVDSLGYEPDKCITGVPSYTGYEFIGQVEGISNTTFLDDNGGVGLTHGKKYCYMVVTLFPDGSESYPSSEECGELTRDVPILDKVSIGITDKDNGVDTISWIKPIDLKTDIWPAPYQYRLKRGVYPSAADQVVYESQIANSLDDLDTFLIETDLNTQEVHYNYKIELLSGPNLLSVGNSSSASSIFLSSMPSDNTLTLTWEEQVPWRNTDYVVYRFSKATPPNDTLLLLDTVQSNVYVDSNLANLNEYMYLVKAIGLYSSSSLENDIQNLSQVHVGIPEDNEPPCPPPGRVIEGDCELSSTIISWQDPNEVCPDVDDVLFYNLYYTSVLGQEPTILETISGSDINEYVRDFQESIAGCYAITAIDSFGNESDFGEVLCIDNCPEYELPNVFTPGGDGLNDYFKPFPYKYVKDIDIVIYNRWGVEVFNSRNPDIRWEGHDLKNGKELPDGVYYYVCIVNEIRLTGIVPREIRSFVQLIRQETVNPNTD
jgi:gliding motility-associated-like protein